MKFWNILYPCLWGWCMCNLCWKCFVGLERN